MQTISFDTGGVLLTIEVTDDGVASMAGFAQSGAEHSLGDRRTQPLIEIMAIGSGHSLSNTRLTHTAIGRRLRFVGYEIVTDGDFEVLTVRTADPQSGVAADAVFRGKRGVPALQTWVELTGGAEPVILQAVSSLATAAFLGAGEVIDDVDLLRGRSDWCAEGRWTTIPLSGRDGLAEINTTLLDHDGRGALSTTSNSTWSSGEYLPTGVLANRATGRSWAWQIEHNGAWHWEIDTLRANENGVVLVITGPNDLDHQWTHRLAPAEMFTSIPVSVAVSAGGYEGAFAALTAQRRAIRRHREVDATLPVIFNDYMNTLMGDPTTEKLLPLIDAAAASGAEYFCIDAGWYDDGGTWWDSVGEWEPSTKRFLHGGLRAVIEHIREVGMQPGLWLEPEVIGVRSPIATTLPESAFLRRYGQRVVEHSRYFLDLRDGSARAHLDSVVDRLVHEYGVRYFKLDYNVTPGAGTDADAFSVGDGLLEANRAHLDWIEGILERHPEVLFENCASGAMRLDYAMMSRLDLASTSDQQDYTLYPAVSASAPTSLLPEQAANWAYPQPEMDPEAAAFALVNGMLGRLYLSGHLDRMAPEQLAVVSEAVAIHKGLRGSIATSTPFWPLGLPAWTDATIALGLHTSDGDLVAVWSRGEPSPIDLQFTMSAGATVETVFPIALPSWQPTVIDARTVRVVPLAPMTARLFRIR